MRDIKEEIIQNRRQRMLQEGASLGIHVPLEREVPLIPFGGDPFLICEIKRRSPSKGNINNELKAKDQAKKYFEAGVRSVSVLTEEDYFGGSLNDLMDVKKAFPELSLLRKDFLINLEDVEISYRAGADAVLLIASALSLTDLSVMYEKARELGLQVLFEVHSLEDIEKANQIRPEITGINCRDLQTFRTDLAIPIQKALHLNYKTKLVFESGIHASWSASIALNNGFDALLVGESVVKNPALIPDILGAFKGRQEQHFWSKLYSRKKSGPLVKICGLTRDEDVLKADALGADLLGFIYAESPRKVDLDYLKNLPETKAQKVLVVQVENEVPKEVLELLNEGHIQALQFHGRESESLLQSFKYPFYKAITLKESEDWNVNKNLPGLRLLVDAFHGDRSGSGVKTLAPELVELVKKDKPLWLAGGLNPENIAQIVQDFEPELVDLASGVETAPGVKDHQKMERFFKELKNVTIS